MKIQVTHVLESSIHASFDFLGVAHHPMTLGLGLRHRPKVLRRGARLPDQPPVSGDTKSRVQTVVCQSLRFTLQSPMTPCHLRWGQKRKLQQLVPEKAGSR